MLEWEFQKPSHLVMTNISYHSISFNHLHLPISPMLAIAYFANPSLTRHFCYISSRIELSSNGRFQGFSH